MELLTTKPMTHFFSYNIEHVYKCYTCFNITSLLKKKGMLHCFSYYPEKFNENSEEEFFLDKPGTYLIEDLPQGRWKVLVEGCKNSPSFKQMKFAFKSLNDKPINSTFNFVFTFYEDLRNNGTIATFYVEYSKSLERSLGSFRSPKSGKPKDCEDIEKFLSFWHRPDIIMDSAIFQKNMNLIYKEIINGSIFLGLPLFKGWTLVVEKKKDLIGSTYKFIKGNKKALFIIKEIEETMHYINITFKKQITDTFSDKDIQILVAKLDDNSAMVQCYAKIKYSVNGFQFNCIQRHHKKVLLGFKELIETK